MPRKTVVPKYLLHARSGQAYTYHRLIDTPDRRMYLGKYGTPDSLKRFEQLCERIRLAAARPVSPVVIPPSATPTIAELLLAYDEFARVHYQRGDALSTEYQCVWYALQPLADLFETEVAATFGPKRLKEVRLALIDKGYCRSYVNHCVSRIKRFFKWAVSEELLPAEVFHALEAVRGLNRGELGVRESAPVRPVELDRVDALLPYVPPVIGDMMRVQYLCATRPTEVCIMRPCDVDRSGDIWLYRPQRHKTERAGKQLTKAIPKAAQSLLEPRLDRAPGAYLFPPAEAVAWSIERRKQQRERTTKRYPCEERRVAERSRQRIERPKRKYQGPHYTADSYRRAIQYGIDRAAESGVVIEPFSPNQLRHAVVTFLAAHLGQQKAQVFVGHECFDTTSIYNERTLAELTEVARQFDALLMASAS